MKNKRKLESTVVINGKKSNNRDKKVNIISKLIFTIFLTIILITILFFTIKNYEINRQFAMEIENFANLNNKTVFSIDKMTLYSSGFATKNQENKPVWNLNIGQFTDIALDINNRSGENGVSYENTIKILYIDNIKYNNVLIGNQSLHYKYLGDFGRVTANEGNKINGKLVYDIVKSGEIDLTEPKMYANASNPIVLEYVNANLKTNEIISDTNAEVVYDGSLLKSTNIPLDKMKCTLSFTIHIINYYNQEYRATAYIDIPIINTINNTTIYDGRLEKVLENTNLIRFFRIK